MNNNIIYDFKKNKQHKSLDISKLQSEKIYLNGSFSLKKKIKNKYLCLRDPCGASKMFYGQLKSSKKIIFANSFTKLLKNCKKKSIFSVPKNSLTEISLNGKILKKNYINSEQTNNNDFYKKFNNKILFFLKSIKKKHGDTCYICLSGGLDSTIIAYYAKKIFKNPITITARFKYVKDKELLSEDMRIANKVSKLLDINILNLFFNYEDIDKKIFNILDSSQDWRDYNVHCAVLNYFIAENLSRNDRLKHPVITGDMMNEFCADYQTEIFKGNKYYIIPKINKKVLQRHLINGLDSSSRETNVFDYFKIPLYQPYCTLVDLYKNLSYQDLIKSNFKYICNGKILPKRILKLVSKKKNRAQMTDKKGGILGYFVNSGLDQDTIIKIFKNKFKVSHLWIKNFISTGQYRTNLGK